MHLDVDLTTSVVPLPVAEHVTYSPDATESKSKELLNSGIRAAQSGDRVKARLLLMEAVELDPKCENGWLWLASISEYPEELMAFLENVLDVNPENERALQWKAATEILLSKTFVQRGKDAAEADQAMYAEDCFRRALQYDQENASAWLWLASLSRDNTERVAFLERVLTIEPNNNAAANALEAIKTEECRAEFEKIKLAASEGRADDATNLLQVFTEKFPEFIEGWMLLSHIAVKPADKLSALERVLELDPDNQAARVSFDSLSRLFAVPEPPQIVFESPMVNTPVMEPENVEPQAVHAESVMVQPATEEFDPFQTCTNFQFSNEFANQETDLPIAAPGEELVFEPSAETLLAEDSEDALLPEAFDDEISISEPDWNRETEAYDAGEMVEFVEEPVAFSATADDVGRASAIPKPEEISFSDQELMTAKTGFETTVESNFIPGEPVHNCPYCAAELEEKHFVCNCCFAVLTLSDLEMVLNNNDADRFTIRVAVERMETERKSREFSEDELTALGIGHLNLRNLQFGYDYLQEASALNPDNIMLASEVNSLLIRMQEIRRQDEIHIAMTRGKTILVVDDSATIRKLVAGKLEKCGHEVFLSCDGVEALEQLKEFVPDLILLDITMPRMDGYEVCRQIRGQHATANVPVVMISGKDGFFDKVRGRMAGTTGYITKPFGPETLMKAIEFYLGGGQDFNEGQSPDDPQSLSTNTSSPE